MTRRLLRRAALALALAAGAGSPLAAQLEPASLGGIGALAQELRTVGTYRRVLLIAAHPDDEDTELLTILARGQGAEAAYLSLSRGEGGQNLIGPELGERLGLIRTEELLAARRLDGARQYFTRAFDFGYSKTLDETLALWPRDELLRDVVRVVRRFRPQVIVAVFSGTPRDGHGQHQASGWAAREAFRAAGDPDRFPELARDEGLAAWAPLKLYRSTRFDTAATTLVLDGGVLDPAVGQSLHQVAMRSRSLHRSQDMGQVQGMGPSRVRLALEQDRTGAGGAGLFAGVDTSLQALLDASLPPGAATAAARLELPRLERLLAEVRSGSWSVPSDALYRRLGEARELLDALAAEAGGPGPEVADLRRHLDRAAAMASGLMLDAVADDAEVAPGQRVHVTVSVWNAGTEPRRAGPVRLSVPPGWAVQAEGPDAAVTVAGGGTVSRAFVVAVPDTAAPTAPYFLRRPRLGAMYDWSAADPAIRGEPFEPPLVVAEVPLEGGLAARREVTFRGNDQGSGEFRQPVLVVPAVDVSVTPASDLRPRAAREPIALAVTLASGTRDTVDGRLELVVPPGWPAPSSVPFRLAGDGALFTWTFRVRPPAGVAAGTAVVAARAVTSRGAELFGRTVVSYPHIRPRPLVGRAESRVTVADLAFPRVGRVGYVRGAADLVPEALAGAGLAVELLSSDTLLRGDLSRYGAIVVGSRAYETEPALAAANDRLLAYARRGGLVLVQYQQYAFFTQGYAPYPLTVASRAPGADPRAAGATMRGATGPGGPALLGGHDRVTDERAPVRVVDPSSPAVRWPNRIGAADWDGWVQERGLYFARTWDARYRTVLEMHDPGEAPLEGGLLVAQVGQGTWVYTGLSFFRQLPAGVPGAFRLFANLLGLAGAR